MRRSDGKNKKQKKQKKIIIGRGAVVVTVGGGESTEYWNLMLQIHSCMLGGLLAICITEMNKIAIEGSAPSPSPLPCRATVVLVLEDRILS